MSLEESNALDTAERQTLLKANLRKGRSEGYTNGLKAFRRVGPLAADVQLSQYRGKRVIKNLHHIEVKLDVWPISVSSESLRSAGVQMGQSVLVSIQGLFCCLFICLFA